MRWWRWWRKWWWWRIRRRKRKRWATVANVERRASTRHARQHNRDRVHGSPRAPETVLTNAPAYALARKHSRETYDGVMSRTQEATTRHAHTSSYATHNRGRRSSSESLSCIRRQATWNPTQNGLWVGLQKNRGSPGSTDPISWRRALEQTGRFFKGLFASLATRTRCLGFSTSCRVPFPNLIELPEVEGHTPFLLRQWEAISSRFLRFEWVLIDTAQLGKWPQFEGFGCANLSCAPSLLFLLFLTAHLFGICVQFGLTDDETLF